MYSCFLNCQCVMSRNKFRKQACKKNVWQKTYAKCCMIPWCFLFSLCCDDLKYKNDVNTKPKWKRGDGIFWNRKVDIYLYNSGYLCVHPSVCLSVRVYVTLETINVMVLKRKASCAKHSLGRGAPLAPPMPSYSYSYKILNIKYLY